MGFDRLNAFCGIIKRWNKRASRDVSKNNNYHILEFKYKVKNKEYK